MCGDFELFTLCPLPQVLSVDSVDQILYDMLICEIRFRIFRQRKTLSMLFREMDTSGNGDLDHEELYEGFKKTLNAEFSPDQVRMFQKFMVKNQEVGANQRAGELTEAGFLSIFGRLGPVLDSYLFLMLRRIAYAVSDDPNTSLDMLWQTGIPRQVSFIWCPHFFSCPGDFYSRGIGVVHMVCDAGPRSGPVSLWFRFHRFLHRFLRRFHRRLGQDDDEQTVSTNFFYSHTNYWPQGGFPVYVQEGRRRNVFSQDRKRTSSKSEPLSWFGAYTSTT